MYSCTCIPTAQALTQRVAHPAFACAGQATSNVFDGTQQLDKHHTLRGIVGPCRLGLLTLYEWYRYVEVGSAYKRPTQPIWVICSESHFTVLFAPDDRAGCDRFPCELCYYDGLANQEALIRLSLSRAPGGGWSSKLGSSASDRGRYEGANIPPLECVIETRWPDVQVDWNGCDPIL